MIASLDAAKTRLIMHLRRNGIEDMDVLKAFDSVPREEFIPHMYWHQAYDDLALPIGLAQTISQPFVVATMTQALELNDRHKVLEIGTGSGYQAAILSRICRRVYTIERHKPLSALATERFGRLAYRNITAMVGDGMKGWEAQAPFDRIIVTAAANDGVPQGLLNQLSVGGIMMAPVGPDGATQTLVRITRTAEHEWHSQELLPVRFVPLLPNVARESMDIEADQNRLLAWA